MSFYFDPDAKGLAVFMGATEAALMELLWEHGQLTVKKARLLLDANPKPAYTTVMTVINRLVDKKLATRQRDGRHFVYLSAIDRNRFVKDRLDMIDSCLNRNFNSIRSTKG